MPIHLTRRALADIRKIRADSIEKHGELVASQYLQKVELSLATIDEHPSVLRERGFTKHLRLYCSGKHVLVCSVIGDHIYVTSVWHGSMNIEQMVPELEPALLQEAEILHQKLTKAQKPREN